MDQTSHLGLVSSSRRPIRRPSWVPVRRRIRPWTCLGFLHDILYEGMATIQLQFGRIASVCTFLVPLIQLLNFWSSYLAFMSYTSSSLSPLFLLIFQAVFPALVSWPQYFLFIVTKNLIWRERPQPMPILKPLNPNISVCKVQPLRTPSPRLYSCIASSLSYLNGASSSASISACSMPLSALVRYSSPWSHFNTPRLAFNCLAHPSQIGGSAQRKKRKRWCRVL